MERLLEKTLTTGETLTVVHWSSSEQIPQHYGQYVQASIASDSHAHLYTEGGWHAYFAEAFKGENYPDIVDHWFIAEIDGVCAGRIWFAYEQSTNWGNFGNVYTEPDFRRRGIMTELMKAFTAEFQRSPVQMLCCCSGNRIAVASYLKVGFELPYGGETGPLAICKSGNYLSVCQQIFDGSPVTEIRPGRRRDQFLCDKILAYCPEVWGRRGTEFCGPGFKVQEFRLAYCEQVAGHGSVMVALNGHGAVVAYAYALYTDALALVDFKAHPLYESSVPELLRQSIGEFQKTYTVRPAIYVRSDNPGKASLVRQAGGCLVAQLPDYIMWGEGAVGMDVFQF